MKTFNAGQIESMNLAFEYAFNFEPNFIEKAGLTPLDHMQSKWDGWYSHQSNPTLAFMKFWSECDKENRNKLMTYINNR